MSVVAPPPYDGRHVLLDLDGCSGLDDAARIETALRDATAAAGATLVDLRLHHFGPGHGVTGVALLAESHISIHSWPEHGHAAVDIFVCGHRCDAEAAARVIAAALDATHLRQRIVARGYGLATAPLDTSG